MELCDVKANHMHIYFCTPETLKNNGFVYNIIVFYGKSMQSLLLHSYNVVTLLQRDALQNLCVTTVTMTLIITI